MSKRVLIVGGIALLAVIATAAIIVVTGAESGPPRFDYVRTIAQARNGNPVTFNRWQDKASWQSTIFGMEGSVSTQKYHVHVSAMYRNAHAADLELGITIHTDEAKSKWAGIELVDKKDSQTSQFGIVGELDFTQDLADRHLSQLTLYLGLVNPRRKAFRGVSWPTDTQIISVQSGMSFPTTAPASPTAHVSFEWGRVDQKLRLADVVATNGTADSAPSGMFPGLSEEVQWTVTLTDEDAAALPQRRVSRSSDEPMPYPVD